MNEALLVSSVRQQELAEQAQHAEAMLRQREQDLAEELAAVRRLQQVSLRLARPDDGHGLYEGLMDAAVAIMRSDFASIQLLHPARGGGGELRLLTYWSFNS